MFVVYTSSAGSGKTYTLTKEYLKLALASHESENGFNPQYFRKILAITFTKDAAQEMKSRVLSKLLAFSQNQELELQTALAQELRIDTETLRQRAKQAFEQIIYHYSDFSIGTIDSFTNKVISAFTQELNIPPSYELDLDTKALTHNAIDELIAKVGNEQADEVTKFLLEFVKNEVENGENWRNIHQKLAQYTGELYQERSRPIARRLAKKELKTYHQSIKKLEWFVREYENDLLRRVQNLIDFVENKGIQWESFYKGAKGLYSFLRKIVEDKDFRAKPSDTVLKILDEDKWYADKSKQKNLIDTHKDVIREQLHYICHKIEKERDRYLLIATILEDLYKVALTGEIHSSLESFKIKNNLVYIAETNEKIAQIIQSEPVPFIYERIGEKYQHLLIDEFQDTSVLQWHNLLPLVENSLANGKFNMIVGDAKQSIYRWRGGEMEQIVNLACAAQPDKSQEHIEGLKSMAQIHFQDQDEALNLLQERYETLRINVQRRNLETNYRSDSQIITFNNTFFEKVANFLAGNYGLVKKVYDEYFKQDVPRSKETNGEVQIHLLEKTENYSYDELTQIKILSIIEENLQQGFRLKDIAILFRNKNNAIKIANLLKEQGYEVISADSLVVSTDEKVSFLVAMLKVLENAENILAKSEALYLFFKAILKQIPTQEQNEQIHQIVYDKTASLDNFLLFFQEKGYRLDFNYLQSLSLYETCQEILRVFEILEKHQENLEYVFRFLDWVMDFESQNHYNLNDLIAEWELKKHEISVDVPAETNAITITTIHKSKGLEYPVVIVPYCDWQAVPDGRHSAWIEKSKLSNVPENLKENLPDYVLMSLKKEHQEILGTNSKEEVEKEVVENLNLMYVAFTRAVHKLYILSRKEGYTNRVDKWINLFVGNLEEYRPDEVQQNQFYRFGKFRSELRKVKETDKKPTFVLEKLVTNKLKRNLK
ncbi:MAG: UvrD-helicase domain-containing protein [Raineya sp.]|nr:UvrD-helicase domain-containing protein [Raineya sp.]